MYKTSKIKLTNLWMKRTLVNMEKEKFRKDENFERSGEENEKAWKEVGGSGCHVESERGTVKPS